MLLLDVSHTCHSRAQTGVQRVVRQLRKALGARAHGITFDPYLGRWRMVQGWENSNLECTMPGGRRGVSWPLLAKVRGRVGRLRNGVLKHEQRLPRTAGTLVPEIFSPDVAERVAELPPPRVAVFHDAIALKLPEFTPAKTVARFPAYLQELLRFDGIAAVSDDSASALREYWDWLGVGARPPIRVIPLGVDVPRRGASDPRLDGDASPHPVVLSVGSIEGRKNHLALLDACERLWGAGENFELHLVGMARPESAAPALARIDELSHHGRPIRHERNADDAALARAYGAATFTVYPSLMEGFGLPVLESIAHGKPCLCAGYGAVGEAAQAGGCLTVRRVDAESLADGMRRLLRDHTLRTKLTVDARSRTLRTWSQYADDLVAFVTELARP